MNKASEHPNTTEALTISAIELANGAMLGMCHCPGRSGVDGSGRHWARDLTQDLASIQAWGASTVLSLIESHEFSRLGVPGFSQAIGQTSLRWLHLPITDMQTPSQATRSAWREQGATLTQALTQGERVVVHCAAGLGRTGMLVAKLLVLQGMPAEEAIAQVRAARPGTIETEAQAEWVKTGDLGAA